MSSSEIGYRFSPTDEELINHFLKQKMLGNDHLVTVIPEINFFNYDPWDLPQMANKSLNAGENCWYYFSARDTSQRRVKRSTSSGIWKVIGMERKIKDVGIKKALVFHHHHVGTAANITRTKWVLREYVPNFEFPNQRDFVICKLQKMGEDVA